RRSYDLQSVQRARRQAIESHKQQPVDAGEGHPLRGFALQDVELMPEHKDFGFQRGSRPEQPDQGAPNQPAKIAHRSRLSPESPGSASCLGFAVGTGYAALIFTTLLPVGDTPR